MSKSDTICPTDWNPHGIPAGYCRCGCGGATRLYPRNYHDRGLKKGNHALYLKFHKNRTNFHIDGNGCWIWNGRPDSDGYAATHWGMKSVRVYRAMYELLRGSVPAGMVMDHLCRVRMCVNPQHLEPVAPAVNIRRGNNSTLTAGDVATIRASTATHAELGRRFRVSATTIYKIRKGLRWITT
jgi:hypothetical protein